MYRWNQREEKVIQNKIEKTKRRKEILERKHKHEQQKRGLRRGSNRDNKTYK